MKVGVFLMGIGTTYSIVAGCDRAVVRAQSVPAQLGPRRCPWFAATNTEATTILVFAFPHSHNEAAKSLSTSRMKEIAGKAHESL
jgi:hypothetical protein